MFLAFLIASAAAMPNGDQAYLEMRAMWLAKGAHLQRILSIDPTPNSRTFHTLGNDPNAACLTAEQSFFTLLNSCFNVGYILNGSNTASDAQVESDITTYCTAGGCSDKLKAAADQLDQNCHQTGVWATQCPKATNCSAAPYPCAIDQDSGTCEPDPHFLSTIRFILSLFCLQGPDGHGGTKYCIPSFYAFVNPTGSCDLQTRLANGCDNCTVQIFAKWSEVEPIEAALNFMQLALECLYLNGTWCVLQQEAFQNYSNALAMDPKGGDCSTFGDPISCVGATRGCVWNKGNQDCEDDWTGAKGAEKFGFFCHPCVGAILWRTVVLIQFADNLGLPDNGTVPRDVTRDNALATLFIRTGVCSRDLSGNFCLAQLQNANGNFTNPCNGIAQVVNETGCCAASVVAFEEAVCRVEVLETGNTTCITDIVTFKGVLAGCSVQLGETCAQLKFKAYVQFYVSNVNASWWADSNNQDLLVQIIANIAAYNGGVNSSAVNCQAQPGRRLLAGNTVVVTGNVDVASDSEYYSVTNGLAQWANLETLNLNENVPSNGLAPVTVSSSGVNPATSSATKAAGGFVVAIVVAIAAFA